MIADVLVISLVVLYSLLVIRKLIRDKRKGVCTGCSGSCSGCHGCDSSYIDALIERVKEGKG